jgi:kinesin family protein 11
MDDFFSPATSRSISKLSATTSQPNLGNSTSSASVTADKGSNVQVVVRCRPPTEAEKRGGDIVLQCANENEVIINGTVKGKLQKKTYTFDQSYGQVSTQEEVYHNAVKPLVEEVLAGFNCTVFAYGQTGTG